MIFDVETRLSEALIKLSYEKPFEKITILDLTAQAGTQSEIKPSLYK
jgi:AcrR family transcriptional regulator